MRLPLIIAHRLRLTIFFFLLLIPALGRAFETGGDERNPFMVWYESAPMTVKPGETVSFSILFQIPEHYYLYEESIKAELESLDGIEVTATSKTEPLEKDDPFFGRIVPVYYNEAELKLSLRMPEAPWGGEKVFKGDIQFQGCSQELCYKLMHVPLEARFVMATNATEEKPSVSQNTDLPSSFGDRIHYYLENPDFSFLAGEGLWWALLIAFIGGLLSDLTPCVWPLIPITLTVIGVRRDQSVGKNFLTSLVLVAGMACMYSILGVTVAALGKSLGFLFQSTFFLLLLEVVLLLMALSLLGLFNIQLPPSLQTRISRISASGYRGIFFIGLTMGLLAAPCVGPIVGGLLVFVAQSQDLLLGFLLLMSFALGMGILFLILGTFYGVLHIRLKGGVWTLWLKKGLGVLMLLVAFYYGSVIYAQFRGPDKAADGFWDYSSMPVALEEARQANKPIVIDFFAQWCPPCLELDHQVWSQNQVREAMEKGWISVKIDCTEETPECKEAVDRFGVIGWPTVVFLDKDQVEVKNKRLVGKVIDAEEMLRILREVENK